MDDEVRGWTVVVSTMIFPPSEVPWVRRHVITDSRTVSLLTCFHYYYQFLGMFFFFFFFFFFLT